MSNQDEELKSFLNSGERLSYLERKLFSMLDSIKPNYTKVTVIKEFISFIGSYEKDIISGQANETVMVAGRYESIQKVDKIEWHKIISALDRYEQSKDHVLADEYGRTDPDDYDEEDDDDFIDEG